VTRAAPVPADAAAPAAAATATAVPAAVPQVALVVVTHDTREEALGCLGGLTPDAVDELVLVDCGSADGTAAAIRQAAPAARVLELANAGFARGANAGIRATTASVVVVANADVRFPPGALRALGAATTATPDRGAVGPRVVYPDGSPQASARRVPTVGTAVGHALLGRLAPTNRWTRRYRALDVDPDRAREADWLSGCVLALRREAFDQVGGFDPGYFLYVEDVDLGTRLRAAGWRMWHEPTVEVVHRVGASTTTHRVRAVVHHARGLDRYVARHLLRGPLAPFARLALRAALALWVVVTLVWERLAPGNVSTTGERVRTRPVTEERA
jgi:N-acetylglucosaminyl-diphospho-decaprenol L-rhamnosyltransferase